MDRFARFQAIPQRLRRIDEVVQEMEARIRKVDDENRNLDHQIVAFQMPPMYRMSVNEVQDRGRRVDDLGAQKLGNGRLRDDLQRRVSKLRAEREVLQREYEEMLLEFGTDGISRRPGRDATIAGAAIDWQGKYRDLLREHEQLQRRPEIRAQTTPSSPVSRDPGARPPVTRPVQSQKEVLGRLVDRIDWGHLGGVFKIRRPRIALNTDPGIEPAGGANVAFEVEAKEDCRAVFYEATFHDRDGVDIPRGRVDHGFARRESCEPVNFQPDPAIQLPFRWLRGTRSHGWFLIPDDLPGGNDLSRIHRIVIRRMRLD